MPEELKARPRWVVWEYGKRRADGRYGKVPVDPETGRWLKRWTSPSKWLTFEEALSTARAGQYGISFIPGDGVIGGDIDRCRDPETGHLDAWVWEIIRRVGGVWYVSPSGTGLRFLTEGTLPEGHRSKTGDFEVYSRSNKVLTLTSRHLYGEALTGSQEGLEWFLGTYIGERDEVKRVTAAGGAQELPPGLTVEEAVERCIAISTERSERSRALFYCDEAYLAAAFPAKKPREDGFPFDWSRADAALIRDAKWNVRHHFGIEPQSETAWEFVDCWMRRSGLMRAKWAKKWRNTTYGRYSFNRLPLKIPQDCGSSGSGRPLREKELCFLWTILEHFERVEHVPAALSREYLQTLTGKPGSTVGYWLRRLVEEKLVVRTSRGCYRLEERGRVEFSRRIEKLNRWKSTGQFRPRSSTYGASRSSSATEGKTPEATADTDTSFLLCSSSCRSREKPSGSHRDETRGLPPLSLDLPPPEHEELTPESVFGDVLKLDHDTSKTKLCKLLTRSFVLRFLEPDLECEVRIPIRSKDTGEDNYPPEGSGPDPWENTIRVRAKYYYKRQILDAIEQHPEEFEASVKRRDRSQRAQNTRLRRLYTKRKREMNELVQSFARFTTLQEAPDAVPSASCVRALVREIREKAARMRAEGQLADFRPRELRA